MQLIQRTYTNRSFISHSRLIGRLFIMFQAFLHLSVSAHAQDEKFTASVSSQQVSVGDQFQLTFTLNGNGKGFRPPSLSDFNVLMGPSQSSSVQIINGSFSQTISFTYILQAVNEGTFKIGSAEITGSIGKMLSNPITITVQKGNSRAGSGKQGSGEGSNQDSKNVFLRASADKSSAYLGEPIVITYRLYTRVQIGQPGFDKIPAMNGFWSQDIQLPQNMEFHQENVDGVNYQVAVIKKLVVFPQRTGALQIEAMEGEVIARVQAKRQTRSNDPFDQFFNDPFFSNPFFSGTQDIKVPLRSEMLRIQVKELPPNAPAGFNGAVGKLNMEATLDKKETKTNEPVTLKIKISGKGNIKLIEAPELSFPPDFEAYDPKENTNLTASAAGVSGTKTFEYLLIPRNAGEYKIPVSAFAYFDLDKKQYQQFPEQNLILTVQKGDDSSPALVAGSVNKSDVQVLSRDIRFIKTNPPDFLSASGNFQQSPVFYTLITSPALLFLMLLLFRKKQEELSANTGLMKSRRARKVALKRLSNAKKYLSASEKEKFLDEMFKSIWGFLSDKLSIPVANLSKETAVAALENLKVPQEMIQELSAAIDSCDMARFAGVAAESNESLYQRGLAIITKLEDHLRA